MPDIEPVQSSDSGVSGWAVFAVAFSVLVLLGAFGWLLVRSLTGDDAETTPSKVTSTTGQLTTAPVLPTISGELAIEDAFDSATVVLFRPDRELVDGWTCAGIDSDVELGTRISVTDGEGNLLGTGELDEGSLVVDGDRMVPRGSVSHRKDFVYANADCVLEFSIPLTAEADFYTVAVGSLGGGAYGHLETYSHLELASFGWFLELAP